jgi:sugar phosphate isomerase/epimerase
MSMDRIAGFGFCTMGDRPDLSGLDRALGRIEETGASHAELSLRDAHVVAGGRIVPEMRRRLETVCARRNLRYTAHGTLAVNFMDEANLEHHKAVCRAMLELTAAVGGSLMVQHPGVIRNRPAGEIDRLHAQERACLRQMGDHAARLGIRIGIETLFVESGDAYTPDPMRLARELRAIDHPHVVGNLDVSHSFIMTSFIGSSLSDAVDAMAPVSGHMHLHDSFGRPTTVRRFYSDSERVAFGMGDLHLPLGWGAIPFETLLPGQPFLPGTVMIVELPARYWAEIDACAEHARRLMSLCNGRAYPAPGAGDSGF